jgi:hypothetical protein
LIPVSIFIRHNSVWTQVAPTMEPVISVVNRKQKSLGTAVMNRTEPQRNALVAETAFLLVSSEFAGHSYRREELEDRAREFLLRLPRGSEALPELTPHEWHEVGRLAQVTQQYTSLLRDPVFSPRIPGCGVVDSATGDVLAGSELIEIKTVSRLFRAADLRQALTYAAMLYSSGRNIEHITLLNPRRARVIKMSVGRVAAGVRGCSAVELLQDLVEAMTDLQVSA